MLELADRRAVARALPDGERKNNDINSSQDSSQIPLFLPVDIVAIAVGGDQISGLKRV